MKEPGGCSTISEQEKGNCNELSRNDGLEIEPSFPRLGFPILAPARHSLQANQAVFPGKWVIIFPSSPRCSNTPISDVMEIFAFHPNPIWLRFPLSLTCAGSVSHGNIAQEIMETTPRAPIIPKRSCLRR